MFELESKEPNNDKSSKNSATGIWTFLRSVVWIKGHSSLQSKRRNLAKASLIKVGRHW